jgi:hypothetical protein
LGEISVARHRTWGKMKNQPFVGLVSGALFFGFIGHPLRPRGIALKERRED